MSYQSRIKQQGHVVQTRPFLTRSEARDWTRQYEARLASSGTGGEPVGTSMPGSSAQWGWLSIGSDLQDHGRTPNLAVQPYPFLDAKAEFNGPMSEEGQSRSAMRGFKGAQRQVRRVLISVMPDAGGARPVMGA